MTRQGIKALASGACVAVMAAAAVGGAVRLAAAETLVENSAEFRFQLDFHVNDAALQKLLPAGWEPQVATQGPAKDCNLRVIFIDRIDVTNPDGTPKTTDQLVYVAIPVKQTTGGTAGQMILGGVVSDAKEAPGAFGTYVAAASAKAQRAFVTANGVTQGDESWEFVAPDGEHFETHVKYERGPARKNPPVEVKFFKPSDPATYQIFKVDSGIDIMRNASVPVKDKVKEFSYKVPGGKLGALFDGSEKALSGDSLHTYNRAILTP